MLYTLMKGERYMDNMEVRRGDVVWVDLGKPEGSEQGGIRPAVVIQNDDGNKHSPCVIVSPITSQFRRPMVTHVGVDPSKETGLYKPSIVITEQIRTIDKSKVLSKVGKLSDNLMNCINRALIASLALA